MAAFTHLQLSSNFIETNLYEEMPHNIEHNRLTKSSYHKQADCVEEKYKYFSNKFSGHGLTDERSRRLVGCGLNNGHSKRSGVVTTEEEKNKRQIGGKSNHRPSSWQTSSKKANDPETKSVSY